MKSRIFLLVIVALLLVGERHVIAEQSSDSQAMYVKALWEELLTTDDVNRQIEIKHELGELLANEERREPHGRLDQGGEDCALATDLTSMPLPIVVSGTTLGFLNDYSALGLGPVPPCWDGYYDELLSCSGPDVVYSFIVPADGIYRFSLCNSDYDTGMLIFNGNCPPNIPVDFLCGNDDFCGVQTEIVALSLSGGQPIQIVVDGWDGDAGNYELVIELADFNPPVNDDCQNALFVEPFSPVTGSTVDASFDEAPDCGTNVTARGVWYTTFGTGNTMTAHTCFGADYDTKINVYSGNDCNALICVGGNDDACGLQSQVDWCSVAGEQYLIMVQGFNNQTGNFTLAVEDDGVPCGGGQVLSIGQVYAQLPFLIGQTVSVIGHASDPSQGILVDTWHELYRNEDFDPNTIIEVTGPDAWTTQILPEWWNGGEIIVTGVIGIEPTAPVGYEAVLDMNDDPVAPDPVVPPSYPTQPDWRPPNWVPNPVCDTCNFAMLISGGIDGNANRADYWEDLVDYYCYKSTHGYCPSGIKVFYADGTRRDDRIPSANVATATQAQIQAHVNSLTAKIQACKDRVGAPKTAKIEVMSSNHGRRGPNGGLNTWGRTGGVGNYITPATFTAMMQSLVNAGATELEIEMGQCYGGQMVNHLRDNLDSKGTKVTAASAAPDSLPSVSQVKQGDVPGFNRWLNPLLCARHNGASLAEAIRQANVAYDAILTEYGTYYTQWAAYKDAQMTPEDTVKAEKYRVFARKDTNARGGETVWYKLAMNKRCQGDTIAVTPGGRLELTFSGPTKSCGNCEVKCKNTNGDWISYRNWNWNVPGSSEFTAGNNIRPLDASAGHTGLYVIHSRSDSFKVSVKAINPPLPPDRLTSPSNPEEFAGFSVGWTSGNSDEFGAINAAVHTIPDVDDDGFNMSTSPKILGSGGVGILIANFDVLAENYWWTNMNLYMSVLDGTPGVAVSYDCPDCENPAGAYILSGGDEEFTLSLGSINTLGSHSISLTADGTTELDCWGLESANSTGTPPAVSDLVIIRDGDDIKLYWSAVPIAGSYIIQTSLAGTGPWIDLDTTNTTSYVHVGEANSNIPQLHYQVIAVGP